MTASGSDAQAIIPNTGWRLWQWAALRSAGFPAATILSFASPGAASAADRIIGQQPNGRSEPFRDVFDAAVQQCSSALRVFAESECFQEAVLWQNPQAYRDSIRWFLRHPDQNNARARQKIQLVASYAQRYCVKNETIGFFGPVGWATIQPVGEPLTATPGKNLLSRRAVYFEPWAIDRLERALSVEDFRPWLAPRPLPFHYIEGDRLHLPLIDSWIAEGHWPPFFGQPIVLSQDQIGLLQLCDGHRPALEIAARLVGSPVFASQADVYRMLQYFCEINVIQWGLHACMELSPERSLRHQLEMIGDESLKALSLSSLTEFEAQKERVRAAAGCVEALNEAMHDLETTFERLTGGLPRRAAGRMYASRTLLYEDCVRDVKVTIGPELIRRLRPVALILESGRWLTHQAAARYREAFCQSYDDLSRKQGSSAIEFHRFSSAAAPIFLNPEWPPMMEVHRELQQRWAGLLRNPASEQRLNFTYDELAQRVSTAFAAPEPGWPLARYCSPDVMIAAQNVAAIHRGDYLLVLGEVHLTNTLAASCFLTNHPDPDALRAARAGEVSEPCVIPVPSLRFNVQRTTFQLVAAQDVLLGYERDHTAATDQRNVSIAELVVDKIDGTLQVRTRDGRRSFDIIHFFGSAIANHCNSFPSLLPPSRHTPRITVDEVVLAREAWQFSAGDIFSERDDRPEARFLQARRFAIAEKLPRFLFVRSKLERKPYYLDLASPIFVDLFARLVRRVLEQAPDSPMVFTEMLPTPEDTWLPDAQGNRYASELRLVAMDWKRVE